MENLEPAKSQPLEPATLSTSKLMTLGLLNLAQEIPSSLSGILGTSIFRGLGASLSQLALFSLPQIPYGLRFLWSPIIDNAARRSHKARRSWIVGAAFAAMLVYIATGSIAPTLENLGLIVLMLTLAQLKTRYRGGVCGQWARIGAVVQHRRAGAGLPCGGLAGSTGVGWSFDVCAGAARADPTRTTATT
jgi:Acetyl-coenzyme A transporter 1